MVRYAGLRTTTIYKWSTRYEAEGAAGFSPYQQNQVYSPKIKLKAVQEYLYGRAVLEKSVKNISYEMTVNAATE